MTTEKQKKHPWEIFKDSDEVQKFLDTFEKNLQAIQNTAQRKLFIMEVMSSPEYRVAKRNFEEVPEKSERRPVPTKRFFDAIHPDHFTVTSRMYASQGQSAISIDLEYFNEFYRRNHMPGAA